MKHLVAAALTLLAASSAQALELHADRSSPYDLAVTGMLSGVPKDGVRFIRWSDLRAMPTSSLVLTGEFMEGQQKVTALFLSDLWKALPVVPGADSLLATCSDGYASAFRAEFIQKYRPFIVLEIDGKGPQSWPPPGLTYDPGPYVITVSEALVPAAKTYRDMEHKRPWSVTTLEVASFSQRDEAIFSGRWASLSPSAADGREIWINSCASCHEGPPGVFGGAKAKRPFQVIEAYAAYDRPFLDKYVRDPKSVISGAKMEPHPNYTDADLDHLVEFLTAGEAGPAADRGGHPTHTLLSGALR